MTQVDYAAKKTEKTCCDRDLSPGEFKFKTLAEIISKYFKLMDNNLEKKISTCAEELICADENKQWKERRMRGQNWERDGRIMGNTGQVPRHINVRENQQKSNNGQRLILEEKVDSTRSVTGTTYDVEKPKGDIINLLEEEMKSLKKTT